MQKQVRHHKSGVETREARPCVQGVEVRMTQDGQPELFGYALKWDTEYRVGWFTERIARGALSDADMSDVRILFNHDPNMVIARTASGTATVGMDDTGMYYRASIPNSPFGQNLIESLKRGDITQSSWAFSIREKGDKWEYREGVGDIRTITSVDTVYDASPVTYPANPDTSVATRSYKRNGGEYESEGTPQTQLIESITELLNDTTEYVDCLNEKADMMTMIASVNADLKPVADELSAKAKTKAAELTAFITELAAAVPVALTGTLPDVAQDEQQRSEHIKTLNCLGRALSRLEAIHKQKQ